jgi:endonuclease YncB( thermonuclease family)
LDRREWTCQTTGKQTCGQILACFVDEEDINRWIVLKGWTLSFRRYKHPYDIEEQQAHDQCTGMWAWSFHAPWDLSAARLQYRNSWLG